MSLFKRTKNTNEPIIRQVLDLIPDRILQSCIVLSNSDKGCHKYMTYYQLVAMTFGKLCKCTTLADISTGLTVSTTFISDSPQKNNFDVLYISQHLFDLDDGVEFMYTNQSIDSFLTGIYNDDGSTILFEPNAFPFVKINVPQDFKPIYNTPNGTKMILSFKKFDVYSLADAPYGISKIYSLPGKLTTSNLHNLNDENIDFLLFPNPSKNYTTIKI